MEQIASYLAIAQGLAILSMMAAAIGEAIVISSAFKAIGRNPKLQSSMFTQVLIAAAVVESTAIYALVAFFVMSGQITQIVELMGA